LFYLTGAVDEGQVLLITNKEARPTLFAPPPDKMRTVWEGVSPNPKLAAERIGANLVLTKNPVLEILPKLRGTRTLYFQNVPGSLSRLVADAVLDEEGHLFSNLPQTLVQLDTLMQELRLYKDPSEIKAIEAAAVVTNKALQAVMPLVRPGIKEWQIARTLEHNFNMEGGRQAFNTIVASGPGAATLHYDKCNRTLRSGELLLIDSGAEVNMYAADITRTVGVGEVTDPVLKEIHQIVLDAQLGAIQKVKHGVLIAKVYDAAAEVMAYGLKDLGILKGTVSKILKTKSYRPYFPHGIGHSLGIDVHDIGELRGNSAAMLKDGMVFTIEPGLYFSKKTGNIPACGVRIEDDILVTKTGRKNLSEGLPKDLNPTL